MINSVGNLGGFVGPFVAGWIEEDQTSGFGAAQGFLAACAVFSALLAFMRCPAGQPDDGKARADAAVGGFCCARASVAGNHPRFVLLDPDQSGSAMVAQASGGPESIRILQGAAGNPSARNIPVWECNGSNGR